MKDYATIERVILKKFKLAQQQSIDPVFATPAVINVFTDEVTRNVSIRFVQYVASQSLDKIKAVYPADWWEAFKERWFPKWLLNKFPVKYKIVKFEAKALYPKIALPKESHEIIVTKFSEDEDLWNEQE